MNSFFDLLSEELLENIARQLSTRPRSKNWAGFIGATDAKLLLSESTPLKNISIKLLRKITIARNIRERKSNHLILSTSNEKTLYANICNVSRSVTEICINMDCFDAKQLSYKNAIARLVSTRSPLFPAAISIATQATQGLKGRLALAAASIAVPLISSVVNPSRTWLDTIAHQCIQLERLEVKDCIDATQFETLITHRGPHLRSLSLHMYKLERFLAPVERNCTRLIDLNISNVSESFDSFWSKIGVNLKSLQLRFTYRSNPFSTFRSIQQYCRKLSHIDLQPPMDVIHQRDLLQVIAELYASYGTQLQHANMQHMHQNGCLLVVQSCPNFYCSGGFRLAPQFDASISSRNVQELVAQLVVLNDRVSKLHVTGSLPFGFAFPRKLSSVTFNFEYIRCIDLGPNAMGLFHFIFQKTQSNLQYFKWKAVPNLSSDMQDLHELLETLSQKTGALKKLSLFADIHELGVFRHIAQSNKLLQSVNIRVSKKYQRNCQIPFLQAIAVDIIDSFSECKNLSELIISFEGEIWTPYKLRVRYEKIRKACFKLRNRGVFVRIGPVVYVA